MIVAHPTGVYKLLRLWRREFWGNLKSVLVFVCSNNTNLLALSWISRHTLISVPLTLAALFAWDVFPPYSTFCFVTSFTSLLNCYLVILCYRAANFLPFESFELRRIMIWLICLKDPFAFNGDENKSPGLKQLGVTAVIKGRDHRGSDQVVSLWR